MRTWVVAVVAALVGAVVAIAVTWPDAPADDVQAEAERPLDCAAVIGPEVLATLGWDEGPQPAQQRLGRCEWAGDDGNITAGVRVAETVDDACDELRDRDGFEDSTSWLGADTPDPGCVVVNEDGLGLYEVLAERSDEVVQVRLAVLEARPVADVRSALVQLVAAA